MTMIDTAVVGTNFNREEFVCDQRGGDSWLVKSGLLNDEFLTIDDEKKAVNWYKATSSYPYSTFSLKNEPLRAVFCGISTSSTTLHESQLDLTNLSIAVLTAGNILNIFLGSGEQYEFLVPFGVEHLISTPSGLLIEKCEKSMVGEEEIASYEYICLRSIYEPLSTVSFREESGNSVDKSYRAIRAHNSILCMVSKITGKMALVNVNPRTKENQQLMDHSQMVNLSIMSGMIFADRSSISEASSRSLERFRNDNSSRLSASSYGGSTTTSQPNAGRIINVGMTKQRSLQRSSPSPTSSRSGRSSSPFLESIPGQQYSNSNTLHSLLGVQQFKGASNRHLRENTNRSAQDGRGHSKLSSRSPKASTADGEGGESEDDLLNFDFLHDAKEERDIIFSESIVELIWYSAVEEVSEDFDDMQVIFSSSHTNSIFLYVAQSQSILKLFRICSHSHRDAVVSLIHEWNEEFTISSMAISHVSHLHDHEFTFPVPLLFCSGSHGIQYSVVGSIIFQSLSMSESRSAQDDKEWIDSIVSGGFHSTTSASSHMDDDDDADGENQEGEQEEIVTSLASGSSYITILTAQPARKLCKMQIRDYVIGNTSSSVGQDLLLTWQRQVIDHALSEELQIWFYAYLFQGSHLSLDLFISFILQAFGIVPFRDIQSVRNLSPLIAYARRIIQQIGSSTIVQDLTDIIYEGIRKNLSYYFMTGTTASASKALSLIWCIMKLQKESVLKLLKLDFEHDFVSKRVSVEDIFLQIISSHSSSTASSEYHLALLSSNAEEHNVGLRFLQLLQAHPHYQVSTSPEDDMFMTDTASFHHPSSLLQIFLEAVFMIYDRQDIDITTWKKILQSLSPVLHHLLQLVKVECLEEVDPSWPPAVLAWIGRTDLYANAVALVLPSSSVTGKPSLSSKEDGQVVEDDGLESLEASSLLRFPEDNRMREVCRMLRSSKPAYLKVDRSAEVSDADHRLNSLEKLSWLLRRSFACPVGRGMLTISTAEPLMAEKLPIPPVSIQGRVPPLNSLIAAESLGDSIVWPEFHNGTAAALRVGPKIQEALRKQDISGGSTSTLFSEDQNKNATSAANTSNQRFQERLQSMRTVTRNWIMYNKTASIVTGHGDNSHAGFLFGLGLFGHLHVLTITDICDYLTQGHEPTTIAILVGVSISKMATADALVSKTLFLHLPSLIPTPHWGIEISPTVQCAALVGIGFLFARSCNRLMMQFLIEELFRKPTSDRCECRESLSLCAAWSLAMIALPRLGNHTARHSKSGSSSTSTAGSGAGMPNIFSIHSELADMKIEDRLFHLIEGGKRPTDLNVFSSSGTAPLIGAADANAKSSRILEGDFLNTDVTSPGATLALGLLYQRSHDDKILRRLELPKTILELNSIRPDNLFYRSVARVLIQWDLVQPTLAWMDAQIPGILAQTRREQLQQLQKSQQQVSQKISLSAMKGDDGQEDDEAENVRPPIKKYVGPYGESRRNQNRLDRKVTLTLIINIYSGIAQGLGLVYAGTFDERVKALLLDRLYWLQGIRENKSKENFCSDKMSKYTIESAICAISLALSCVMAGSGDLDCLRLFRSFRWRVDSDQTYGSHMVYGMAIGMLFLGGGKFSLKRDPVSIACLLMSVLPRYPNRATDQQTHLQALRHLYVLAVEPRILQTIDVTTGVPVSVDLELQLIDGRTVTAHAPGLLPELQSIHRISVKAQNQTHQSFYQCSMDLQYLMGNHHINHQALTQDSPSPGKESGKLGRQVSSPHSPWRAWAATQQAYAEVSMMQHCALLPPLYVKIKPSDAIIPSTAVGSDADVDNKKEAECSKKESLSFLLKHIFSDFHASSSFNVDEITACPSAEQVDMVTEATHAVFLKQLWQFSNVQQTLLGALGK